MALESVIAHTKKCISGPIKADGIPTDRAVESAWDCQAHLPVAATTTTGEIAIAAAVAVGCGNCRVRKAWFVPFDDMSAPGTGATGRIQVQKFDATVVATLELAATTTLSAGTAYPMVVADAASRILETETLWGTVTKDDSDSFSTPVGNITIRYEIMDDTA